MSILLDDYVKRSSSAPVHPAVTAMADHVRSKHTNIAAVLAYGSALRDSNPENTVMDFYVVTQSLDGVSNNRVSRLLCGLVPPNVYYAEVIRASVSYRCKYAVMPIELLAHKVRSNIANPYFWVRFAQPMQVLWTSDAQAKTRILQILISAMETANAHAKQLAPPPEQWTELFRNTYQTELRPEDASRAAMIVAMQRSHYDTISKYADNVTPSTLSWRLRHWQGKALSILRLFKASFTFQGGADYAAWKIKRHSGVEIEVTDWHRRHPVLAAVLLLPKLLRKGGLK
jgi:hypothetical protein